MFTFRTFRKILLGSILLVSAASLVLSLYLKPHFVHPNSAYVLIGILDTLIFAAVLSITRKKLLASAQPVATEVLGLFTLLPFALILVLYAISIQVATSEPTTMWIFAILQILIFIGTILHGLYTICLIATAMLTVCVFDRDVWCRDIDSSPSPFPMSVLFRSICPCFASPDPAFFEDTPEQEHEALVPCLPGCNCSVAKTKTLVNISESEGSSGLEPETRMVGGLSSRSLVLVPSEVERRTSIMVSFEGAAYEEV
ncbi:hypothetical protein C8R46DRAFT_1055164 [Mycena filopes]|nr:hypothetical protein C8R46DRAFT_1055164 [Mycena filopes]